MALVDRGDKTTENDHCPPTGQGEGRKKKTHISATAELSDKLLGSVNLSSFLSFPFFCFLCCLYFISLSLIGYFMYFIILSSYLILIDRFLLFRFTPRSLSTSGRLF